MKKEIKEKWLAALRSGEYTQGTSMLRKRGDKFCCLGVLCDLHAKETGNSWENTDKGSGEGEITYLGCVSTIPEEVQEWAGIGCGNPYVFSESNNEEGTLALFNDSYMFSFEELANTIEKQL